jgi:hypothetical protein
VSLDQDGETYSFCTGTYYVNIQISADDVTVQSKLGFREDVVLDGAGQGTVLRANGAGLDTSVLDLSIQNGEGDYHTDHGFELAGGVGCFAYAPPFDWSNPTWSSMTLAGVNIRQNHSQLGGGILTIGCHLTLDDTVITENDAEVYGGLYAGNGDMSFTDVEVSEHQDISGLAGISLSNWTSTTPWTASFQDVRIVNNSSSATSSGAAFFLNDYNLTWSSTGAGKSTLYGNSGADDGDAVMRFDGDLTVQGVDFGEAGSSNDNQDLDLYDSQSYSYYVAGDSSTFACTGGNGCGNPDKYTLGGWNQSGISSSGFYGNVVYVDTRATVISYSLGLANSNCSTRRALIFERSTVANGASQSWEVMWTGNSTSWSSSFVSSGNVGKVLEAGKYYAFVLGYDCGSSGGSGGVHTDTTGSSGVDVGIGITKGSVSKFGTYASIYTGSTLTMTFDGVQKVYEMDLFVTEL